MALVGLVARMGPEALLTAACRRCGVRIDYCVARKHSLSVFTLKRRARDD
jgi:hypothetical protein